MLERVRLTRVRRRAARWGAWMTVGGMVIPVLLMMVAVPLKGVASFGDGLMGVALWAWLVGWLGAPVLALGSLALAARVRQPETSIVVRDGGIDLVGERGARRIERGGIAGALVVAGDDDEAEVELALTSGDMLCAQVGRVGRGRELVSALGFGADQRRVAVPLGGPRDSLAAGCGGVLFGMMAAVLATCFGAAVAMDVRVLENLVPYFVGLVFVGVTLAAVRALSPQRVVIGADGVVREGFFRARFFPRDAIVGVERIGPRLSLLVGRDDRVKEVTLTSESAERQRALMLRIRAALDLPGKGASDPRGAMLGRGAESVERWRDRLRRIVAPETGYRGESVPVETLLDTASDASVGVETRVGAAMAIGLGHDEVAKRELRAAIEGLANERLRIALEGAARGEADEEALAALVEEEARLAAARRSRAPER